MREHLYRGIDRKAGIWVFGSYLYLEKYREKYGVERNNIHLIMPRAIDKEMTIGLMGIEVIPETVGQFIGLKDKNNMMIFGGDIFTVCGRCPKLVKFIDKLAAFCIANVNQLKDEKWNNIWGSISEVWWHEFGHEIEVIGNIHDNPELLEAQNVA